MSTEITTVQQMSVNDMMTMAKTFAESGMFTDTKQLTQAFVKIQAGQEIGIPPFASMTGIHIIQGKPAIGAGLMASRVKSSGKYDYKVIEQTDKNCSIDFFQGKEKIGNSTFNIEDAKKAQTKNLDKFPKNMLFARAMSNGVKWFCPDVFSGSVYTPEELNSISQEETMDVTHEVVIEQPTPEERLKSCATLQELAKTYTSLTADEKRATAALKDELKARLESDGSK